MLRLATMDRVELALVLHHYGLTLTLTAPHEDIPGSYWGDSEAGLKGDSCTRGSIPRCTRCCTKPVTMSA